MELTLSREFYPAGRAPVSRQKICALESAILEQVPQKDLLPIEERTGHYFAPGLYCREFQLNAGEVAVGKIHKHAHLITLVRGDVEIVDEFDRRSISGPKTWVSTPGVKRVVYARSDALFLTFHPTEETDLAKIEEHVIAPDYASLDSFLSNTALTSDKEIVL
jgi:hypothetical protein